MANNSLIARALHDNTPLEFAPERLSTLPSMTNPSLTGANETFARTAMLGILGVGVVVPTTDPSFVLSCATALSAEGLIRDALAIELDSSPSHLRESFMTMLSNHRIVSGILGRLERYQSEGEQKAAGLEIGVSGHSSIFGRALRGELEEIYCTGTNELPSELVSTCEDWGRAQAEARELILQHTWDSIVRREDWPRPRGFDRVVSGFLEGHPLTYESLVNSELRLANWLDTVQTLRDKSGTPLFHSASTLKRDNITAADVVAASALLHEQGLPAWSESLWKISPGLEAAISREIWPDADTLPEHVSFAAGVPSQITISITQAIDHWSRYIGALPLDGVTIHTHAMDFSEQAALSQNLAEVGHTPLVNFIHRVEIDLHEATTAQIERSLRASINLLSAMVKGSDWHDNSREHLVTLALLHCPEGDRVSAVRMLRTEARRIPWRMTELSPFASTSRYNHLTLAFHYSPK
mgnify:CR=1 FL=1